MKFKLNFIEFNKKIYKYKINFQMKDIEINKTRYKTKIFNNS